MNRHEWRSLGLAALAAVACGTAARAIAAPNQARGSDTASAIRQDDGLYAANATMHLTDGGDPEVVGEIVNGTSGTVAGVTIVIYFYDANGNDLNTDIYTGIGQVEIPAGTSAPFQARTHLPLPGLSSFAVAINYYAPAGATQLHDFDVQLSDIHPDANNTLAVNGAVTNRSGVTADTYSVNVMIGLYDGQGNLIRLASALVDRALAPGASAPWNTYVSNAPASYAGVKFWVEARPAP